MNKNNTFSAITWTLNRSKLKPWLIDGKLDNDLPLEMQTFDALSHIVESAHSPFSPHFEAQTRILFP